MKNLELRVGEKVTWTVGKIVSRGCFLERMDDGTCIIITHFVGGMPCNRECRVIESILTLDI